jgi:hypothetical protein
MSEQPDDDDWGHDWPRYIDDEDDGGTRLDTAIAVFAFALCAFLFLYLAWQVWIR